MYILACMTLQGYLYAIGGNNGVASLDTCERYDPHLNKWTLIEPMKKRRAGAGVAELHGYLYVVGMPSLCSHISVLQISLCWWFAISLPGYLYAVSRPFLCFIVFHLPQPLDGCWYLLCQGSGYFLQPASLNIFPDLTLV